jgi:two-component system, NtrC family, sensor kinase
MDAVSRARLGTLGLLVAGVAHELNTPLGALQSNHDVLKRALGKLAVILEDEKVEEDELDELRRVVRAIGDILRVNDLAVDRMGQIVGSLRVFGRVDRAEVDRVDLHEGLESTLTLLAHRTGEGVRVVKEFQGPLVVECRPHELNQVFMNLLLNAIQAVGGAGTITIRTETEGEEAVVTVHDTGPGVPPEALARIFEPGFTTKGSRIGMGLGLPISRRIVDDHGGRIEVESRPGEGTSVRVRLPVRLGSGGGAGRAEEATGV